jgi:hypothetical protein
MELGCCGLTKVASWNFFSFLVHWHKRKENHSWSLSELAIKFFYNPLLQRNRKREGERETTPPFLTLLCLKCVTSKNQVFNLVAREIVLRDGDFQRWIGPERPFLVNGIQALMKKCSWRCQLVYCQVRIQSCLPFKRIQLSPIISSKTLNLNSQPLEGWENKFPFFVNYAFEGILLK